MGDKDQGTGGGGQDGSGGPPGAGGGDDKVPPVGVFLAGAAVGLVVGLGVGNFL